MKNHSMIGIAGIIFAIFAICLFPAIFLMGLGAFILALIFSILSISFGAAAYWGRWKDKLGKTDFIIGVIVLIIWLVTAIYMYMSMSMVAMYGTPLYRPKVK